MRPRGRVHSFLAHGFHAPRGRWWVSIASSILAQRAARDDIPAVRATDGASGGTKKNEKAAADSAAASSGSARQTVRHDVSGSEQTSRIGTRIVPPSHSTADGPSPSTIGVSRAALRPFRRGKNMLWTILVVLGILWLLGFSLHIGGSLIHLLLVLGLVALIFSAFTGRRYA
jgi:hypothetical protein